MPPSYRKHDLVLQSARRLLRAGADANLVNLLQKEYPHDIAAVLRALAPGERQSAFDLLVDRHPRLAMESVAELSPELAGALLAERGTDDIARLLDEVAADDAAAIVEALPADKHAAVVERLRGSGRHVADLLTHDERTAGRLMNPNVFALPEDATARDAVEALQRAGGLEMVFYVYVVDERRHLVGVVSLRRLLLVPPDTPLKRIMTTEPVSVSVDALQEDVAAVVTRYNLLAVPVVDGENKLAGVVTVDDVIDVIKDETTADMQRLGGVEALDEPYVQTPFWTLVKKRARWLVVLFVGEMLTATAMGYFEKEISKAVVLALFLPLVISSGGNSGSQAASLIIRALALGEVGLADWWRVMRRELLSGLVLGGILGTVGLIRVSVWAQIFGTYGAHWFVVAVTVGLALVGVVMWGTLAGSMLPFVMKRIGADPAASSAPFVATLVDVTGLVIYFTVAAVILRGTLL